MAKFLENESAQQIRDLIANFWVTVLTRFRSMILHYQRVQFAAQYFQSSYSQTGIISKETPTR